MGTKGENSDYPSNDNVGMKLHLGSTGGPLVHYVASEEVSSGIPNCI